MTWEIAQKFGPQGSTSKYAEYSNRIAVFVYPRGDMGLTMRSCQVLGDPKFVNLMSDGKLIGIKAARVEYPNAFALGASNSKQGKNGLRRIACKLFSNQHGLTWPGKLVIWDACIKDGVLIIDTTKKPLDVFDHIERHRTLKK